MLHSLKDKLAELGKTRITVEFPKKKHTLDTQKACESLKAKSKSYIETLKSPERFQRLRNWFMRQGLEWSSKAYAYFAKAAGEPSTPSANGREPMQKILLQRSQAFLGELSRERKFRQTADHLKRASEQLGVKGRRAFAQGRQEMARFLGKTNGSAQ